MTTSLDWNLTLSLLSISFIAVCVCVLRLHMYLCARLIAGAFGGQEKASDALGLELLMAVNLHVGAGN